MARTQSNGTNTSTAAIGFEAGTESSPELQFARAMADFDFVHLRFAPVVLANRSMSSNQFGEGDIRRTIIEADLVDCMVALLGQISFIGKT